MGPAPAFAGAGPSSLNGSIEGRVGKSVHLGAERKVGRVRSGSAAKAGPPGRRGSSGELWSLARQTPSLLQLAGAGEPGADGAVIVELPYAGHRYLARELLKEAGDAVVLEPEDARQAVLEAAEVLAGAVKR